VQTYAKMMTLEPDEHDEGFGFDGVEIQGGFLPLDVFLAHDHLLSQKKMDPSVVSIISQRLRKGHQVILAGLFPQKEWENTGEIPWEIR
jgi:hypothetical protein